MVSVCASRPVPVLSQASANGSALVSSGIKWLRLQCFSATLHPYRTHTHTHTCTQTHTPWTLCDCLLTLLNATFSKQSEPHSTDPWSFTSRDAAARASPGASAPAVSLHWGSLTLVSLFCQRSTRVVIRQSVLGSS